jgi:hypothetical protein
MSFGGNHAAFVSTEGALVMLGDNTMGQSTPPANLGLVSAARCGLDFTAVLTTEGAVACFGDNTQGQCNVPGTLGPVLEIAAGRAHVIARRPNGTVVGWGSAAGSVPSNLGAVQSIAAGGTGSAAIALSGSVRVWYSATTSFTLSAPATGSWSKIAIGAFGTTLPSTTRWLALRSDGMQIHNSDSPFGLVIPEEAYPAVDIAVGRRGYLVLRSDGQLFPVLLSPTTDASKAPGPASGVTAVFAGELQFALLRNELGDLDGDGQIGSPDLAILLSAWGTAGSPADLDGSGAVSSTDLAILLAAWTPS